MSLKREEYFRAKHNSCDLSEWVWVEREFSRIYSIINTNHLSAITVRGAPCGIEAIILGVITSIGGFLFGYDTVELYV